MRSNRAISVCFFMVLLVCTMISQSVSAGGYWELTDEYRDYTDGDSDISVQWEATSDTGVAGLYVGKKPAWACTHKISSTFSWEAPPQVIYPESTISIPYGVDQNVCTGDCISNAASYMRVGYHFASRDVWGLNQVDNSHKESLLLPCVGGKNVQTTYLTGTGSAVTSGTSDQDRDRMLEVICRLGSDYYKVQYYYIWRD